MKIRESELIINQDGSAFHIHIKPEQLADNVILVGDPGRITLFEDLFDRIEAGNTSREFRFITGSRKGKRFTVLSTGIGTDNIDIVMTELDALANVDFQTREVKPEHRSLNVLRIGTCGAIQEDIPIGSPILSHISIGFDGLMNWYSDRDSICDKEMEESFLNQVAWNKYLPTPYFVHSSQKIIDMFKDVTVKGVTISSPGFYGPQGRVVRQELALPDMLEEIRKFRFGEWKITNFEMESSAIAGFCRKLGHEGATICCAIANRYCKSANTNYKSDMRDLIIKVIDRLSE